MTLINLSVAFGAVRAALSLQSQIISMVELVGRGGLSPANRDATIMQMQRDLDTLDAFLRGLRGAVPLDDGIEQ